MSTNLPAIARIAPQTAAAPHSLPAATDAPQTAPAIPPEDDQRWTPARQAEFLRALAATHNVALAARAAGMSRQSAYRLRARLKGQPFDRAWAMAFGGAFDALAEAAVDRALNGVEVPHFYKGELVGTSRRYDERLTLNLLGMRGALGQLPPVPSRSIAPRDLDELIERVAQGPEQWTDDTRASRPRR